MGATPIDLDEARRKRGGKGGGGSRKPPARVDDPSLNQDRIALRFAEERAESARYNWHTGEWHLWDGICWRRSETQEAIELVRELCRRIAGDTPLRNVVGRLGSAGFVRGVEGLARSDRRLAVLADAFDPDPLMLATPGGIVDLRDGSMRSARPASMVSLATAVTPADDDGGAARWRSFLAEAAGGDGELVEYLQRVAGYWLTGLTVEQCLFFFWGPGGNGKSVFVNTIRRLMGGYAANSPMETFTAQANGGEQHPTALAMLRAARLVTASESEKGKAWAEARIKSLTGGDAITARFMRENFFTYQPKFKLGLLGNHQPVLQSVDEAIRRRFRMIPFTHQPAEVDPELELALEAEWPAILRWAIDGCREWQASGLGSPDVVRATTGRYLADQDVVGNWLESQCEVTQPPYSALDERCPKSRVGVLYDNFKRWCEEQGMRPWTSPTLMRELEKRGFPAHRTSEARWRLGLALKADAARGRGGYDGVGI